MATILTSTASQFSTSTINSVGISNIPFIGSRINNSINNNIRSNFDNLGAYLDDKLFSSDEDIPVRGSRLTDISLQSSNYGQVIPIIYGKVKIAGNIIFASQLTETLVTKKISGTGKGGDIISAPAQKESRYNYTVSLAIAICEGEIANIDNIYADEKIINLGDFCSSYNILKGNEEQNTDSILEALLGTGNTPAYKGLAYIVIENLNITAFNNRIPNFTFEVRSQLANNDSNSKAENMLKEICLIPGSGEFVYDTNIQRKLQGREINGKFIQFGQEQTINSSGFRDSLEQNITDAVKSIDNLQENFPNLEWVSVICGWFADSLDASTATIAPRVEYQQNSISIPDNWSVAGLNRTTAQQVIYDNNGNPLFGGTPSDSSIINLITELKSRGLKVAFYPFLFVEALDKPWRGRITCDVGNVHNFFNGTGKYNDFILHYANLLAAQNNGIDAFIIGSEMKGLTSLQNNNNAFPAVDELCSLAASVKTILTSSNNVDTQTAVVTYAADWSEYHSVNGWFNMDKLWADTNIDVIGIDAYFPLTNDIQQNLYDKSLIANGWQSGEGYDYYYTDEARTQIQALAAQYAWKNIHHWWSNNHTNPDENTTSYTPSFKPIWFTEFGFPSVDGCSNQPNVFFDDNSSESALPYHSQGAIDFTAQRLAIEATLDFWQTDKQIENFTTEMVAKKFLWTWDARPYPYWPYLTDKWSDGNLWAYGHWIQGKLGGDRLVDVLENILNRAGINNNNLAKSINNNNILNDLEGFVINKTSKASDIIDILSICYNFDLYDREENIIFYTKGNENIKQIYLDDIILPNQLDKDKPISNVIETIQTSQNKLIKAVEVNFLDKNNNYSLSNINYDSDYDNNGKKLELNLPIILSKNAAVKIAQNTLFEENNGSETYKFSLDVANANIEIGDIIQVVDNRKTIENGQANINYGEVILQMKVNNISQDSLDKAIIEITAFRYDYQLYKDNIISLNGTDDLLKNSQIYSINNYNNAAKLEILDINLLPYDDIDKASLKIATCPTDSNENDINIYYSANGDDEYRQSITVDAPSTIGNVLDFTTSVNAACPYIVDEQNSFEIALYNGELFSASETSLNDGSNIAIIGDEIIQFANVEQISQHQYKVSSLKRGLFGTEKKIPLHELGERFILLNENIYDLEIPLGLRGSDISFKAVHNGQDINNIPAQTHTYETNKFRPYHVVNVQYNIEPISGDISFTWNRRSRIFSLWKEITDVQLGQKTEKYLIEILDNSSFEQIAFYQTNEPKFTYENAQILKDFNNSYPTHFMVNISQISDISSKSEVSELAVVTT